MRPEATVEDQRQSHTLTRWLSKADALDACDVRTK